VAEESLIGKVLGRAFLPVERGKIREFARAIQDGNPVFSGRDAAVAAGFADVAAPLTYSVVQSHFSDGVNLTGELDLDLARVLHGQSGWTYHRTPVAGDVLSGETVVANVFKKPGKQGGEMTFVEIETTYRDEAGQPVITEKMTVIETALVVSA
jgi:hypothetical protein